MTYAALDLGTNTFHLIIAEDIAGQTHIRYKTNTPVKLGEDITKNNEIIPAAFQRGITCLQRYKAIMDEFEVQQVKAVATSGVRSATNGQAFIDAVKTETGITITLIDGQTEALLIYEAVKMSGAITGKSLIMDIGGGSTEFIFCDEEQMYWKRSFEIGAAKLMQRFFHSDPMNATDLNLLKEHITTVFTDLLSYGNEFKPETLIGVAGAFETYAQLLTPKLNLAEIAYTDIAVNGFEQLAQQLIASTHQQRLAIPNLIPLRIDMIVMAAVLTQLVLANLKLTKMKLATYDLKMGVLKTMQTT